MPRMSKNAPAKVNASIKRLEAAKLRASGLTFEEIAERLGLSESRARELVNEFMAQLGADSKELHAKIVQQHLLELSLLKRTWFPAALELKNGPKTLEAFLKLQDRERKAAGVPDSLKIEANVSGADGGPLQVDFSSASTQQLLQLHQLISELSTPPKV